MDFEYMGIANGFSIDGQILPVIDRWFRVDGPGVRNVKIPAKDADDAVEIASRISLTPAKFLRVWCHSRKGAVECWHSAQVL